MLTPDGLVWHTSVYDMSRKMVRHDPPGTPGELEIYGEQREELAHEVLTPEECRPENGREHTGMSTVRHQGEIPLALMYPELCQDSRTIQAGSYSVKHRAEAPEPPPHHISNGSRVAATLMAGGRAGQEMVHSRVRWNAELFIVEPNPCPYRTRDAGWTCGRLVPADAGSLICDDCRAARSRRGPADETPLTPDQTVPTSGNPVANGVQGNRTMTDSPRWQPSPRVR